MIPDTVPKAIPIVAPTAADPSLVGANVVGAVNGALVVGGVGACDVGAKVGALDRVGESDGALDGLLEGRLVEGDLDGRDVVGDTLGRDVLGDDVGREVLGAFEGLLLGLEVVGDVVGENVGSPRMTNGRLSPIALLDEVDEP